jgi:hypothetical protein
MKKVIQHKKVIIIAAVLGILVVVGLIYFSNRSSQPEEVAIKPTPKPEPVNIIPVSDRPYVTLEPLTARNQLEIVIHDLKVPAEKVEVALEYDRNQGVLDAVLKQFRLDNLPLVENLFMGSKSAGGHITYHDDVIGGDLNLKFSGDQRYSLQTPWRYDDTQKQYEEFSTSDGKFQIVFVEPFKTPKMLIMLSPGLPESVDGEILAGPYLFRGVGGLPDSQVELKVRLNETVETAQLLGWDGDAWLELDSEIIDKTLTATDESFEAYIVTE